MMAMASTYLHEKIHWQRWICLFLGFVGILIILRPDGSVFQFAGGIALLTGITYAISNVLVKRLDANDSNISIVFYPSVMIALIAAIWLPSVWIMPTPGDWMLFLLAGVLGWAALQSLVMALRLAPVSIVAPLEYSSLLWVVGIDYVFFNLVPSLNMMAGACLIIVSNLYIVFHEAKFRPQDYLHDAD
jgi:drug/metabolite transporter (DMT)-like permease